MLLPIPTPNDIERFRALHLKEFGVDLPQDEAKCILTKVVQLYFLTGGYELSKHNERVRLMERQRRRAGRAQEDSKVSRF